MTDAAAATPLRLNRDFALLWIGEAVSTVGSQMTLVAYPLLVLEMTGSPAKAGIAAFANRLPLFIFQLHAGALVDRWNRKRVLALTDLGRAIAVGSIVVALALDALSFPQILIVAFVEGALTVLFRPAVMAGIARIVPRSQLTLAIARNEARDATAALVGPPIGGALFGIARFVPFLADTISYLVSLVAVLAIQTPLRAAPVRDRQRIHLEIIEGVRWLWHRPFLRASLLLVGGSNLVSNAVGLLVILLARERGASGGLVGTMLSIVAAGSLAGAFAAPYLQRRLPPRLVVVGYPCVVVPLVPLLTIAPGPLGLGAVTAAMIFLGPTWNALIFGYQLALAPDDLQGRVSSVDWLLSGTGAAVGPLLAGVLLSVTTPTSAIWTIAAIAVVIAAVAIGSRALHALPDAAAAAR